MNKQLITWEIEKIKLAIAEIEKEMSREEVIQDPVKKAAVALIVGHEEKSPGAYSHYFDQNEYQFWKKRVGTILSSFEKKGFDGKVFFRDGVGISGAYRNANSFLDKYEKKLIIELHFNAFNGTATGTEVLYHGSDPVETKIATEMCEKVSKILGLKNRGAKNVTGRGHGNVTQVTGYPSLLPEFFFGDNPSDCATFAEHEKDVYEACAKICHSNLMG